MSSDAAAAAPEPQSVTEAILGRELVNLPMWARFRAWPAEYRATLAAVLFAGLVFIPFLGAVGLWDCWETHYGEVAREMIQRNDYVHPYWENAWFFSKPVFTMWMMATGMQLADLGPLSGVALGVLLLGGAYLLFTHKGLKAEITRREFFGGAGPLLEFWAATVGVLGALFLLLGLMGSVTSVKWKLAHIAEGDGALPLFTEWAFRLPFALFSVLAIGLLTYALSRTVNARAALASAFIMATMPLYFLLSRQAVTDPPIVSATIAGIACALVAMGDKESKARAAWWYAAYVFFGFATLAKGLLGFGIPMVVFFIYVFVCVVPLTGAELSKHWNWVVKNVGTQLGISVGAGALAGLVARGIGASWGTMFMSTPAAGPLPEIGAPGWLGIMWGSLAFWVAMTAQLHQMRDKFKERPPALWALCFEMRLGTGILLFLAVCLPWYYEMFTFWRVDDESKIFWYRFIVHDHFARLGAGVHSTSSGGFTYFIEQGAYGMFPWVVLLPGAFAIIGRLKARGGTGFDTAGIIAVLWFAVTWGLIGASATKFHHYVFPMLPPLAILMGLYVDKLWTEGMDLHLATLLFGVPILVLVGKDLSANPKDFTDLFVYNYDRPYPQMLVERPMLGGNNIKQLIMAGLVLFTGLGVVFAVFRAKSATVLSTMAGALVFALWFNWSHWVDLSHHWTQRDQFWRYYSQRQPGEPIAAFLMNWRGETFYSRNQVKQIKDNPNVGMFNYAAQPGRKWSLVEHNRLSILKQAVGPEKKVTEIDNDLNVKFTLVTIE